MSTIQQRIEAGTPTVGDVRLALAVLKIAGKQSGVTEKMTVKTLWSKIGQRIAKAQDVR